MNHHRETDERALRAESQQQQQQQQQREELGQLGYWTYGQRNKGKLNVIMDVSVSSDKLEEAELLLGFERPVKRAHRVTSGQITRSKLF